MGKALVVAGVGSMGVSRGRSVWSRWMALWAGLAIALMAVGCGGMTSYQKSASAELAGVWEDTGGVLFTFVRDGSGLSVTRIIDTDGEIFPVQRAEWEDQVYVITYLVPSTGYVVTIQVLSIDGDTMSTTWSNVTPEGGTNAGEELYTRAK